MFRTWLGHYPYGRFRVERRLIGDELAEMLMVALLLLVLDDHWVTIGILCHQIHIEIARALLNLRTGEFYVSISFSMSTLSFSQGVNWRASPRQTSLKGTLLIFPILISFISPPNN